MTFEDLQKANKTIATTDIKGKEYAEVNQRIKAFRQCFPEGFIKTQMLSNQDGVCVFRAEVGYYDSGIVSIILGTGTAYEKETSSYINKTSYIENCETSAVGRALGMCGFGIDTSVASYEEVSNAIKQQEAQQEPKKEEAPRETPAVVKPKHTEAQLAMKKELLQLGLKAQVPSDVICQQAGVEDLADVTPMVFAKLKAALLRKIGRDSGNQSEAGGDQ